MAYASNFLTDEEKKKQQESGLNTSGIVDGYTSPGGGGASGAAPQQEKTPGTGYLNLAQYLDANKGKGAELANKATEDLQKSVTGYGTEAQKTLDTTKSKFDEAAGTDKAEGVKSAITNDPYTNKQTAKDFLGAGYSGPAATDYTSTLASQKDKLTGQLGKVDDFETQQQALQNAYGKAGNYTSGYGLLDSFLLRGDESGQAKINEVKGKARDVSNTYDQAAQELAQREQAAKEQLARNKKAILDTAIGKKDAIEQTGQQRLQTLDKQNEAYKQNEGYQSGSLGDVLQDKDKMDLEALAEIARLDPNSDWYKKTFDAGKAKAGQAPAAVDGTKTPAVTAEDVNKGILGGPAGGAITKAPMGDYTNIGDTIQDAARAGEVIKPIIDLSNVPSNTGRAIDDFARNPSIDRLQTTHDEGFKKPLGTIERTGDNIGRETLDAAGKINAEAARGANSIDRYAKSDESLPVLKQIAQAAAPVAKNASNVGGQVINAAKDVRDFGNDLKEKANAPLSIPKLKAALGGGGGSVSKGSSAAGATTQQKKKQVK